MFPAGSKLFIGLSASAIAGTLVYGFLQNWGALGVVGVGSAAVAFAFLAGVVIASRNGTVAATEPGALTTSNAAQQPPANSLWPLVGAVGGTLLVIGLVTDRRWFVGGLVALFATFVEWTVQNWSERASGDATFNARARGVLIHPLELPILAAVGLGVLVYSFSRIMLNASNTVGPILFSAMAALITLFGFIFAAKRRPNTRTIVGICVVGAVGIVAGGIWAAADGEKPGLAEEGHIFRDKPGEPSVRSECGAEVNEADKDASGSVSAKSSVTAVIHLKGNQLLADEFGTPVLDILLPKGNASNLLFKNENGSDAPLRLAAEFLVSALDSNGKPTADLAKQVVCTNAIPSGKAQMLTLTIPKSSDVDTKGTSFKLYIPGLDGAEIQLEVH